MGRFKQAYPNVYKILVIVTVYFLKRKGKIVYLPCFPFGTVMSSKLQNNIIFVNKDICLARIIWNKVLTLSVYEWSKHDFFLLISVNNHPSTSLIGGFWAGRVLNP